MIVKSTSVQSTTSDSRPPTPEAIETLVSLAIRLKIAARTKQITADPGALPKRKTPTNINTPAIMPGNSRRMKRSTHPEPINRKMGTRARAINRTPTTLAMRLSDEFMSADLPDEKRIQDQKDQAVISSVSRAPSKPCAAPSFCRVSEDLGQCGTVNRVEFRTFGYAIFEKPSTSSVRSRKRALPLPAHYRCHKPANLTAIIEPDIVAVVILP